MEGSLLIYNYEIKRLRVELKSHKQNWSNSRNNGIFAHQLLFFKASIIANDNCLCVSFDSLGAGIFHEIRCN